MSDDLEPLALCCVWFCRGTGSSVLCCRHRKADDGCGISGLSGDVSVCTKLEASLIAPMNMRPREDEDNFPGCFPFGFSCSFAKQFKVGKMTARL